MTNKTTSVGAVAGVVVGFVAFVVLALTWGAAWSGFTLSVLWGWFMVPLFGLPALTVAQAFGVALVVRAMHGLSSGDQNKFKGDGLDATLHLIFVPPFMCGVALLFGWAVKAWA